MYGEVSVYAANFVIYGVAYKGGICGKMDSYVGGRLLCCIWG
jgi:hypothetical protein